MSLADTAPDVYCVAVVMTILNLNTNVDPTAPISLTTPAIVETFPVASITSVPMFTCPTEVFPLFAHTASAAL